MTGAAAAMALALALGEAPALPSSEAVRFAVVVGNNRPETGRAETLRYADDDAVATHHLLLEAGVDSVLLARLDDDSRKLHPELAPFGAPRGKELDDAFVATVAKIRQAAARGAETELLIFYSGHGDVDGGEGYVVLEDRRLTRSWLHELLAISRRRATTSSSTPASRTSWPSRRDRAVTDWRRPRRC